jgi:hypothetical protein
MNPTIIDPATDEKTLMTKWLPQARFQLPSELKLRDYMRWLTQTFIEFLKFCHPTENHWEWERFYFPAENGHEGGIGNIMVGEVHFDGCKLHAYDGESRGNPGDWKGFMMRDHADKRSKVAPIYLFANHFERFCRQYGIVCKRYGRPVEGHDEVLQELDT